MLLALQMFLMGYVHPCFSCLLMNPVGPFLGGVNPSGWVAMRINLDHQVCNTVELFLIVSGAYRILPLGVLLVWLVRSSSDVV